MSLRIAMLRMGMFIMRMFRMSMIVMRMIGVSMRPVGMSTLRWLLRLLLIHRVNYGILIQKRL